jgi:hypothetical protein
VRTRLAALLAALFAACFPATALADDPPAPSDPQPAAVSDPAAESDPQPSDPAPQSVPAAVPDPQPAAPACLPAQGGRARAQAVRGVRVGVRARISDASGMPLAISSVKYCVQGGGDFSLALSRDQDVVLVLSTAHGDSIGDVNPTSPAQSARMAFPKMRKLTRAGKATVYRVDKRRQVILGVAAGRVSFVAVADRLLLEYPNKLGYYMRRLGF